ncbi:integrase core domain-containing protein [Thalassobacterium sedimentorum]|uniref:integrase core domain-containing protein n=1 Tax=Thalassobacterium sedimentorum TaxID=3041258 RepID=UPI003CE5501A
MQTRVGCPQQNGYTESFVSAIKCECIDHMIFFSEKSLRRAVEQYIDHFHHERTTKCRRRRPITKVSII